MLIKDILFGYYGTQCLAILAKLAIADHLEKGPQTIAELAKLTQSNENKLYRVMRFMSANGLFDELANKVFKLNAESMLLLSSHSGCLRDFILLHSEYFYPAASELTNSLATETTSFELKFGKLAGTYFTEQAAAGTLYNSAMRGNSELYSQLIADAYDFSPYQTIVDVGGGIGGLLVSLLSHYKNAHGINFDLPELQKTAEALFKEKNVASRCQYVGGDFFKSVPKGGDIYLMKAILHGKNDAAAAKVLNRCKEVIPKNGKLLVIERIITKNVGNYVEACVNDINMMNVTRGHVRTLAEFETLFKAVNCSITQVLPLQDALFMLEIKML